MSDQWSLERQDRAFLLLSLSLVLSQPPHFLPGAEHRLGTRLPFLPPGDYWVELPCLRWSVPKSCAQTTLSSRKEKGSGVTSPNLGLAPEVWSDQSNCVALITSIVSLKVLLWDHYPTLTNLYFYTNNYKASTLPASRIQARTPGPFLVRGCMARIQTRDTRPFPCEWLHGTQAKDSGLRDTRPFSCERLHGTQAKNSGLWHRPFPCERLHWILIWKLGSHLRKSQESWSVEIRKINWSDLMQPF